MPMTRHGKLFGSRGPPPLRAIQLYSIIHRRRLGVGSAQGALRRGGRALSCFNTMYGILGFTAVRLYPTRSLMSKALMPHQVIMPLPRISEQSLASGSGSLYSDSNMDSKVPRLYLQRAH